MYYKIPTFFVKKKHFLCIKPADITITHYIMALSTKQFNSREGWRSPRHLINIKNVLKINGYFYLNNINAYNILLYNKVSRPIY